MNSFTSRFTISQLALGISRISVRYGHIKSRWKQPRPDLAGHPPGHGEKIYIFTNIYTKEIVYSHTKVLHVYKAFKQMPFAGKKNNVSKIRKDYWRPFAVISFPEGQGVVGQSVFQRLREFRTRHLLEWDECLYFKENPDKPGKKLSRTRVERGRAIIDQKANSVADLAVVLAGAGAGTRMWLTNEDGNKELCPAKVEWMYEGDQRYATGWSSNVTHGVMEGGIRQELVDIDENDPEAGQAIVENERVSEVLRKRDQEPEEPDVKAEAAPEMPVPEVELPKKKGLFSWS